MYAKSHTRSAISDEILPVCNLVGDVFQFPPLEYIYKFRVVVSTLITAGCLTRARENRGYDPVHFSHIIIDEAASVTETLTMVPIAGI